MCFVQEQGVCSLTPSPDRAYTTFSTAAVEFQTLHQSFLPRRDAADGAVSFASVSQTGRERKRKGHHCLDPPSAALCHLRLIGMSGTRGRSDRMLCNKGFPPRTKKVEREKVNETETDKEQKNRQRKRQQSRHRERENKREVGRKKDRDLDRKQMCERNGERG